MNESNENSYHHPINRAERVRAELAANAPLLTNEAAAAFLGFKPGTLRVSRTSGLLAGIQTPPYLKIGRRVAYEREALEKWLSNFRTMRNTAYPTKAAS